jgi:hypothetical protein
VEITVFGKTVDNYFAALLAVSNIGRVLEVLSHRAKEETGPRFWAISGKIAQLKRLRMQVRSVYLNG